MQPAGARDPVAEPFADCYRLEWHPDPLTPRTYPRGRFRFDAPSGEFPVIYTADNESACFAEVFGDKRLIEVVDGDRRLFRLSATRSLRLLQLDDGAVSMSFNLDARICTIKPYRRTQLWSRAFHRWFPDLDGLRYVPRHATGKTNYCLYLDRCGADLDATDLGRLASLPDAVDRALAAYPLASLL